MGSSYPAVVDYLVDGLKNGKTVTWRPITVPALSSVNPVVEVADAFVSTSDGVWVIVGQGDWESNAAGSGSGVYAAVGAERIEETYTVPCLIDVITSGTVMKAARDAAFALYDGVVQLVHADPTFGGALQQGRIGMVSGFTVTQSQGSGQSGASVRAQIPFEIQVHNFYNPQIP